MNLDKPQLSSTRGVPAGPAAHSGLKPASASGESRVDNLPCTSPSVSIIVPCRNEAKAIGAFIASLLCQDLEGLAWEAIIADGMSDDGTRELLQQMAAAHRQIRIIDNPSRIVSTGLNACVRVARGDIFIRMDVHTEYKSDYVRRCVEVLRSTNAANVGGAWLAIQTGYVGRAIAGAFHSAFAVGGALGHRPSYEGPVDTVYLGCWRREVLEQIGGFDETLVRNQDDELNFRLTRAGGTIWQSPEIVSWYHPRSSLGALFRQYFQYGFWKAAVIRKHRQPASWRHLAPGIFVLFNLAVLAAALLARFSGRGLFSWFATAGIAMDLAYVAASLAAAFQVAKKDGWTLFPVLPLVFGTYHFAYGLGFLFGVFRFSTNPPDGRYRDSAVTQLTR